MITKETRLIVSDNSGAKIVKCIGLKMGKKFAKTGDIITVSIQKCQPRLNIKKGDIFKALIIRTRYPIVRKNSLTIRFGDNAVILLNDKQLPMANRIHKGAAYEAKLIMPQISSLVEKIY